MSDHNNDEKVLSLDEAAAMFGLSPAAEREASSPYDFRIDNNLFQGVSRLAAEVFGEDSDQAERDSFVGNCMLDLWRSMKEAEDNGKIGMPWDAEAAAAIEAEFEAGVLYSERRTAADPRYLRPYGGGEAFDRRMALDALCLQVIADQDRWGAEAIEAFLPIAKEARGGKDDDPAMDSRIDVLAQRFVRKFIHAKKKEAAEDGPDAERVVGFPAPRAEPKVTEFSLDPFSHEVAGGLLQKTAEWIIETSFVPSRELSLLAALGVMAAFMGRRYVGPTGLSPNLYLVGLASTGAGKDAPLSAIKTALLGHGSMNHFLGSGDLTSGPAIMRLVRARPSCISTIDEIGAWMQEGSMYNAPPHARTRRKALLELYTSSKKGGVYLGRDSAGEKELSSDTPMFSPCMSILGMSTEEAFFKGLTEENLTDGLMNRLTLIHIPPVDERRRHMADPEMPTDLKKAFSTAAEDWPVKGSLARLNCSTSSFKPHLHTVPYADAVAEAAFDSVWNKQEAMLKADPGAEGICKRIAEQAMKLAMIRAVSRDFVTPAVTAEDIEFGAAFVFKSVEMLRSGINRYLYGSPFEEACKTILRHVQAAGSEGITDWYLRRLSGVSKLDPRRYDEAVKFLTTYGHWRVAKPSNRGPRYYPT